MLIRKPVTLKRRMYTLLIISTVLPLVLLWLITSMGVLRLYQEKTEDTIRLEMQQIKANMEILEDSLKFVSQQLFIDSEAMNMLRQYFVGDQYDKSDALLYLNSRIAVYEISNPNIMNITFLRMQDGAVEMINPSLIHMELPGEAYRLAQRNLLTIYGPHTTRSMVGNYPVLSLLREVTVFGQEGVYVYVETGFRKLDAFSSVPLDELNAIYTVVSDDGRVTYSSKPEIIPEQTVWNTASGPVTVMDEAYFAYEDIAKTGWHLNVFVPQVAYRSYVTMLSWSFLGIAFATIAFSVVIGGLLWRSVKRPLDIFAGNLNQILMDDVEASIRVIHVPELDQNFAYFEELKQRILELVLETQKQEREKAQLLIKQTIFKINPHFIHNTLNTLKWYSSSHGYTDVEGFISALNRLLLYNMEKEPKTTLQSEIDSIDDYIALQRLKYAIDYEKTIRVPRMMLFSQTPRFMLYPLMENAILHGLEGSGRIALDVAVNDEGFLQISIQDSGTPMTPEKVERIFSQIESPSARGIGLRYVDQILQAQYDDAYQLLITPEANGNMFRIVIPFTAGDVE